MAGFLFRLETADGAPADPPTLSAAVLNSTAGHTIPLGKRTLRVLGKRDDEADLPPVLIVEDAAGIWRVAAETVEKRSIAALPRRVRAN
jgi:hypothetical protein